MENPVEDIDEVLEALCKGSPEKQRGAIETYFLPDAVFIHPFCRVPSARPVALPTLLPGHSHRVCSRDAIHAIYRWYRFLSPHIDFQIDSRAYDKRNRILYVTIRQRFAIWFIPGYSANVRLVSELHLSQDLPPPPNDTQQQQQQQGAGKGAPPARLRYYIASQEDHYQVNEYLRFILPVVGPLTWTVWQLISSLVCVVLAVPVFILDRALKRKEVLLRI